MRSRILASTVMVVALVASIADPAGSAGTTRLVSHAVGSPSAGANSNSVNGSVSADGRFVVFVSGATNLVDGFADNNGTSPRDAYLYDRRTGETTLISHAVGESTEGSNGTGVDDYPVIAGDPTVGYRVFFSAGSTNLVAGFVDGNGSADAFVFDIATGSISLISHKHDSPLTGGNGTSYPRPTADGSAVILFSYATDLLEGFVDNNASFNADTYLVRLNPRSIALVSHAGDGLNGANGYANGVPVADGSDVLLQSQATNLVDGFIDNNEGDTDVYRYDVATGQITLVSHHWDDPTAGGNERSDLSFSASSDGGYVPFASSATDLVQGFQDNNGADAGDVYLHDAAGGTNRLVSHAPNSDTEGSNGAAPSAAIISADGKTVVFSTSATNLAGTHPEQDVVDTFSYSVKTGAVSLVSHQAGNKKVAADELTVAGAVSANGKTIVLTSFATNLVANLEGASADYQIYTRTLKKKRLPNGRTKLVPVVRLVSHRHDSVKVPSNAAAFLAGWDSTLRTIAWMSQSTDLVAGFTDGGTEDPDFHVYVSGR